MDKEKKRLKDIFTSYWSYFSLRVACKLNIFDEIKNGNNDLDLLCSKTNSDLFSIEKLLGALCHLGVLKKSEQDFYQLTQMGSILTENHPETLKNACLFWGEEHLISWKNLDYTIKTGKPSFEKVFGTPFFDYLSQNKDARRLYHLAMTEYARDAYRDIADVIDFSRHKSIMDIGGGFGTLLSYILKINPRIKGYLFDLPEVVNLSKGKKNLDFQLIPGDFFKKIPPVADGIVMSHVLHDWNDKKATSILKNAYQALPHNGLLYIVEIFRDKIQDGAALLNLNMLVICNSYKELRRNIQRS